MDLDVITGNMEAMYESSKMANTLDNQMNVNEQQVTKNFFRPFLPSPERSTPLKSNPTMEPARVKKDEQTHVNLIESRMVPKKRHLATFYQSLIDSDDQPTSNETLTVSNKINLNTGHKPPGIQGASTSNAHIDRRVQFDHFKTEKDPLQPCKFSVAEFEQLLQHNINSNKLKMQKEQQERPNDQLAFISVSYNKNHLMSIPIQMTTNNRLRKSRSNNKRNRARNDPVN